MKVKSLKTNRIKSTAPGGIYLSRPSPVVRFKFGPPPQPLNVEIKDHSFHLLESYSGGRGKVEAGRH